MTTTWFEAIKLPYLDRARRARRSQREIGTRHAPDLSRHLLLDVGLLDGRETGQGRSEPPATAWDLMQRYR